MTKIIGLTGGIGSGKTKIARLFESEGIPVYIADEHAKRVMASDPVTAALRKAFSDEVFNDNTLNRAKLAEKVFSDPTALARLNAIVHPAVRLDFERWLTAQNAPMVIREAAILFESGSYTDCDKIITVTAPESVRIARVMQRDNTTEAAVRARMTHQWSDEKKAALSDFVIENTDWAETQLKTQEIIKNLKNL